MIFPSLAQLFVGSLLSCWSLLITLVHLQELTYFPPQENGLILVINHEGTTGFLNYSTCLLHKRELHANWLSRLKYGGQDCLSPGNNGWQSYWLRLALNSQHDASVCVFFPNLGSDSGQEVTNSHPCVIYTAMVESWGWVLEGWERGFMNHSCPMTGNPNIFHTENTMAENTAWLKTARNIIWTFFLKSYYHILCCQKPCYDFFLSSNWLMAHSIINSY